MKPIPYLTLCALLTLAAQLARAEQPRYPEYPGGDYGAHEFAPAWTPPPNPFGQYPSHAQGGMMGMTPSQPAHRWGGAGYPWDGGYPGPKKTWIDPPPKTESAHATHSSSYPPSHRPNPGWPPRGNGWRSSNPFATGGGMGGGARANHQYGASHHAYSQPPARPEPPRDEWWRQPPTVAAPPPVPTPPTAARSPAEPAIYESAEQMLRGAEPPLPAHLSRELVGPPLWEVRDAGAPTPETATAPETLPSPSAAQGPEAAMHGQ